MLGTDAAVSNAAAESSFFCSFWLVDCSCWRRVFKSCMQNWFN